MTKTVASILCFALGCALGRPAGAESTLDILSVSRELRVYTYDSTYSRDMHTGHWDDEITQSRGNAFVVASQDATVTPSRVWGVGSANSFRYAEFGPTAIAKSQIEVFFSVTEPTTIEHSGTLTVTDLTGVTVGGSVRFQIESLTGPWHFLRTMANEPPGSLAWDTSSVVPPGTYRLEAWCYSLINAYEGAVSVDWALDVRVVPAPGSCLFGVSLSWLSRRRRGA